MLCCVTYKATIYKHIRGVNRYVKLIYAICTDYTDNVGSLPTLNIYMLNLLCDTTL